MGKLIIISGPSCVGKGPLVDTLNLYFDSVGRPRPHKHVLYNSRTKRPGEEDGKTYHFWSIAEQEKEELNNSKCTTFTVHGDKQMINFETLENEVKMYDVVLLEIAIDHVPTVLDKCIEYGITVKQIFVSPLSKDDFRLIGGNYEDLHDREIALKAVMLTKLANRGTETKEKQEDRFSNASKEFQIAIDNGAEMVCNHFGEDNKRLWDLFQEFVSKPGSLEIVKTFIHFLNVIDNTR